MWIVAKTSWEWQSKENVIKKVIKDQNYTAGEYVFLNSVSWKKQTCSIFSRNWIQKNNAANHQIFDIARFNLLNSINRVR